MFGKKKKDDDLRSPSGWGAAIHKTVMFLTYPFRRWWQLLLIFLVVAAAAYAVPMYKGVKFTEVHVWYADKIRQATTDVKNNLKSGKLSEVSGKLSDIIDNIPALKKEPAKGTDQLVEVKHDYREVRRQMFRAAAAGNRPQRVDVLREEAADVVALPVPEPFIPAAEPVVSDERPQPAPTEKKTQIADKPVIVKNVEKSDGDVLRYLEEPVMVSGKVLVHNANELEVNGTYLFLYGIYSSPRTVRGAKATAFLRDALQGETVSCRILAYTADDVATGECFAGDVSINEVLVDRGYADRVVLEQEM